MKRTLPGEVWRRCRDEWITMRIEVKGKKAKLYLNDAQQPALVVNDLKSGENAAGGGIVGG